MHARARVGTCMGGTWRVHVHGHVHVHVHGHVHGHGHGHVACACARVHACSRAGVHFLDIDLHEGEGHAVRVHAIRAHARKEMADHAMANPLIGPAHLGRLSHRESLARASLAISEDRTVVTQQGGGYERLSDRMEAARWARHRERERESCARGMRTRGSDAGGPRHRGISCVIVRIRTACDMA